MNFKNKSAQIFVPDNSAPDQAVTRTTHLAIAAHQDDIEIMAAGPILECFQKPDAWFTSVTVTDGRGSARTGQYAHYTDNQMRDIRIEEQKKAAVIGEYNAHIFLDYASSAIKNSASQDPVRDLIAVLESTQPQFVYTHNLADKHDTHVAVALRVIEAIRLLPEHARPKYLYGCEAWRDLDWLNDSDKVIFNLSQHENLQAALLGVFDSQIAGGKRYDLATTGRRRAHATYYQTHAVDNATGLAFAMDLSPLIRDASLNPADYLQEYIDRFTQDVKKRIELVSRKT